MANSGDVRKAKEPKLPEMVFVGCIYAVIGWALFAVGSCTVKEFQSTARRASEAQAQADYAKAQPAQTGEPSDVVVLAGAQQAIKERAVDPASVRFRRLRVHKQASGTKAVCGEFNARNRAGGYNGFQRFISAGTDGLTWTDAEVADFDNAWQGLCTSQEGDPNYSAGPASPDPAAGFKAR